MKRLRLALRTGSMKTKAEREREREIWNRDMGLVRSPRVKASETALYEASELERNDPEAYLKLIEAHTTLLLELGKQMKHVEQLQINAWFDRLSIILVRLKRWEEARRQLEEFFALPEHYRGRSSPSELRSMKKRLERCTAQIR
jgi:hypothetical protein